MMRQDAVSPGDWPTGFMLIQGNRLESLCALMTTWMRRHPLRPLENELILVQSNGIAQWLKLALARPPNDDPSDDPGGGCGIAAAVQLSLPARFVWQVYGQVLGTLPDASSFDKAPLTWRLYRLLGALDELASSQTESDQLAPLHGFLRSDTDVRRRHQLAERLADLYDQYQVYRADWLAAWQAGEDTLIRPDGSRVPVPQAQRWQPLLWRRLVSEITTNQPATGGGGAAPGEASRAEIHQRFLDQARTLDWSRRPAGLPRRLIVFGI
jgi:exodeoxyribonuclease V gamma subunit